MSGPPDLPAEGEAPPRRPWPRWLLGLAGLGLFLAGGVLGAILVLSLTLYRAPAGPLAQLSNPTARPATMPPAASPRPSTPTPMPTWTRLAVGPRVGQEAPEFTLAGLDGITYTLAAYRGKAVLVNFWASWCPPCREEWPEYLAFEEGYTATDVVVLSVNVAEPAEVVRQFVGDGPVLFPILLDGEGSVRRSYQVLGLPTTFLIDPQGIVRQVVPGNLDRATLERLVRPWRSESTP
jgi:cytochrome c biogenesis protein CcmG/thiol:disulfide interchange protein DsbE